MKKTQTLEEEINEFIEYWDQDKIISLLRDTIPFFELFDISDEEDWVSDAVGEENQATIRWIRTVYLVSKMAEIQAGRLLYVNTKFKRLWRRMENANMGTYSENQDAE